MNRLVIMSMAVLLVTGCSQPVADSEESAMTQAEAGTLSAEEAAQIEREIRQTVDEYVEAVKAKDIPAALSFWSNTADFVHAGDGKIFGGYEEWSSYVANSLEAVDEYLYWNNSDIHVVVLARNAAAYTMNFEVATVTDGEKNEISGSWTYVFRKSESGWQVIQSNGAHVGLNYYE